MMPAISVTRVPGLTVSSSEPLVKARSESLSVTLER
jgi:hypothetical protein